MKISSSINRVYLSGTVSGKPFYGTSRNGAKFGVVRIISNSFGGNTGKISGRRLASFRIYRSFCFTDVVLSRFGIPLLFLLLEFHAEATNYKIFQTTW